MKSFQPKPAAAADELPPAAPVQARAAQCPQKRRLASLPRRQKFLPLRVPDEGRNPEIDFHGQKRSNETHASVTDPEARLYRNLLSHMGHALMENRNGLAVDVLTQADGHADSPRLP